MLGPIPDMNIKTSFSFQYLIPCLLPQQLSLEDKLLKYKYHFFPHWCSFETSSMHIVIVLFQKMGIDISWFCIHPFFFPPFSFISYFCLQRKPPCHNEGFTSNTSWFHCMQNVIIELLSCGEEHRTFTAFSFHQKNVSGPNNGIHAQHLPIISHPYG